MTHFTDKAKVIVKKYGMDIFPHPSEAITLISQVAESEYKRGRETMREECAKIALTGFPRGHNLSCDNPLERGGCTCGLSLSIKTATAIRSIEL